MSTEKNLQTPPDSAQGLVSVVRAQRIRFAKSVYTIIAMAFTVAGLGAYVVIKDVENRKTRGQLSEALAKSRSEHDAIKSKLSLREEENEKQCAQKLHASDLNIKYLQKAFERLKVEVPEDVRLAAERIPIDPSMGSDTRQLEEKCKRGKGLLAACGARALQQLGTTSPKKNSSDWYRAMPWLKWGCPDELSNTRMHRSVDACELLGRAHLRGTPSIPVPDKQLAAKYYGYSCMLGSSLGCRRAGQIVFSDFKANLGDRSKYQEARLLFVSACAGGDGEGCFLLAAALSFDMYISERETWMQVRRACLARYLPACKEISRFPRPFRKRDDEIKADLAGDGDFDE